MKFTHLERTGRAGRVHAWNIEKKKQNKKHCQRKHNQVYSTLVQSTEDDLAEELQAQTSIRRSIYAYLAVLFSVLEKQKKIEKKNWFYQANFSAASSDSSKV